jgi:pimeloyl-ACP methyl ester carboxylesterase
MGGRAVQTFWARGVVVLMVCWALAQAGAEATEPVQQSVSNAYVSPTGSQAEGRTNVVVIVHGYTANPGIWADAFATSYADRLGAAADDWDVWALDWQYGARDFSTIYPQTESEINAQLQGQFVANVLSSLDTYDNIHLIGHSLGGRVIESAANLLQQRTDAAIHTTFFDGYTPYNWHLNYGETSDWSEHYYSKGDAALTDVQFPNAMNIDVSAYLEPIPEDYFPEYAFREASWVHNHPHRWYKETVDTIEEEPPFDHDYGWELSAGGAGTNGWPRDGYDVGTNVVLSPSVSGAVVSTSAVASVGSQSANWMKVNLSGAVAEDSTDGPTPTGEVLLTNGVLSLGADFADPAWANVTFNTTEPINFIQFEYDFTEIGDAGMLEVLLNGHFLFAAQDFLALDGFVSTGRISWTGTDFFGNPVTTALAAGNYVLSFRLDTGSDFGTAVDIRNITGGLIGIPEPWSVALLVVGGLGGLRRRRGGGICDLRIQI